MTDPSEVYSIFFFSAVFSLFVAIYWDRKGLNPGIGFITSFLLSPLLGFIIGLAMPPNEKRLMEKRGERKCPVCGEKIKKDAVLCRWCGTDFRLKQEAGEV